MPNGEPQPSDAAWTDTVLLRIDAVLNAAHRAGCSDLVLGAWGCGAFHNPPQAVAAAFCRQLAAPRWRGVFRRVVFAITSPQGAVDHNFRAFWDSVWAKGIGHDSMAVALGQ